MNTRISKIDQNNDRFIKDFSHGTGHGNGTSHGSGHSEANRWYGDSSRFNGEGCRDGSGYGSGKGEGLNDPCDIDSGRIEDGCWVDLSFFKVFNSHE